RETSIWSGYGSFRDVRGRAVKTNRRVQGAVKCDLEAGSKRRFQLRQHLEQIAHQADVGDLEDRRVGVLVDRHDGARVLDAGQVLDRTADADRHVQLRGDDLAGLADLHLVGAVAGV